MNTVELENRFNEVLKHKQDLAKSLTKELTVVLNRDNYIKAVVKRLRKLLNRTLLDIELLQSTYDWSNIDKRVKTNKVLGFTYFKVTTYKRVNTIKRVPMI